MTAGFAYRVSTAGLAKSNGSLLPGLWHDSLHVTCGLTACTPGSALGPTLGNECGKTLPFILIILIILYNWLYNWLQSTGWLKIKYPTGEYTISPQPMVVLHGSVVV